MWLYYQTEWASAQENLASFKKKSNIFSLLRLLVFGLMAILLYFFLDNQSFAGTIGAFFLGIMAFMFLVFKQGKIEKQVIYFERRSAVLQNELNILSGKKNGYDDGGRFADDAHAYTSDLDIFGPESLFQLVNRCSTQNGNEMLANWFSSAVDKTTIERRQDAAQEISTKPELKIHWQTLLWFAKDERKFLPGSFFHQLKKANQIPFSTFLKTYSTISGWLFLAVAVASFFYTPLLKLLGALATFNFLLANLTAKYAYSSMQMAENMGKTLSAYAAVFGLIETEEWKSELTKSTAAELMKQGKPVSERISSLGKIISKMNYMSNLLVGGFLNISAVWGLKQFFALEKWKRENQYSFDGAFEAIGHFEALFSLGTLKMNNPGWHQPLIIDSGNYVLKTANLAHPLIAEEKRIANDFHLDGHQIDIITGSNMAGKSTFLRTAGINMVMAFAGAVVCAGEMQVSVVQLFSYMRIRDSLAESTSTFKAEIDRLKMLLQVCDSGAKVYFLIDEMLRGTNSVDKYAGSKAVLEKLIAKKAVGMFATHDLEIAKMEDEHPAYIRNFYFDISMRGEEMIFDYKLKTGACKTFNAAILLRQIGIEVVKPA